MSSQGFMPARPRRSMRAAFCVLLAALGLSAPARAQSADAEPVVSWEVKNRFRLFRTESDFRRHVAAHSSSIRATESRLAQETGGRGWARLTVNALCLDPSGRLPDMCERDGVQEPYLAPADHRVGVRLRGTVPSGAVCRMNFDTGDGPPQRLETPCSQEVELRVRYGRPTIASVEIVQQSGEVHVVTSEILVRDYLIAGLGDSIASGDGNPDRPIALSDEGFCFRRFISGSSGDFFRPSRAGYNGDRSCETARGTPDNAEWTRLGAMWMNQACHRSLYGYQLRAALALATENPHIAVTFIPLGCTGATIEAGLLGGQRSREIQCGPRACPNTMPAQVAQLQEMLAAARRRNPLRALDLVLLTIGANDIYFSGLVADVIIESSAERLVFGRGGVIATVKDAETALEKTLPKSFARLRAALKPLVSGDLSRVVYVAYGNPVLAGDQTPCASSRMGFDVHPAFGIDAARVQRVSTFVNERFFPRLKALATCAGTCAGGNDDSMTFVDAHQRSFAGHGVCAQAGDDPEFDLACFKPDGTSFNSDLAQSSTEPLACGRPVKEFRPYAKRARWIRTANDAYFAAMTYPEGVPSALQPSDIHDATWGVMSAVYGGAVHPSAEGHAAMADAAILEMRRVLKIVTKDAPIVTAPLAPLPAPAASEQ